MRNLSSEGRPPVGLPRAAEGGRRPTARSISTRAEITPRAVGGSPRHPFGALTTQAVSAPPAHPAVGRPGDTARRAEHPAAAVGPGGQLRIPVLPLASSGMCLPRQRPVNAPSILESS
ncbi:hypothetical protein GCM10022284_61940 [Streptomyces hundungensis]